VKAKIKTGISKSERNQILQKVGGVRAGISSC